MSDPLPTQLIQIEEPGERRDVLDDAGLSIGLEFTQAGLRIAVSVGGNAEIVRGVGGSLDFVSPGDGNPAADAEAAIRGLMRLTQRTVAGAVIVAPPLASTAVRASLLDAAETAGVDVLAMIERPLAIALGGGLGRHPDGDYLYLEELGDIILHAWLEVADGDVRLGTVSRLGNMAETAVERSPAGLILIGPITERIDEFPGVARLDGFDAPELAVLGAALRAEEMR